jgi:hypothetical protein
MLRLVDTRAGELLGRRFSPIDVAKWFLNGTVCRAWSSWFAILAIQRPTKGNRVPVWVTVRVDVCHAHCAGGSVYMPLSGDVNLFILVEC